MRHSNASNAGDIVKPKGSRGGVKDVSSVDGAPDGGYGWLIVLGSFVTHCLIDGVTYAFGIYTPDIVEYYGVSRQTVGWINSILVGVTFVSGPLTGKLCERFGFRAVTIAGGLLSAIGFSVVFLHPNLVIFILACSVLGGFGFGLVFLPSICIVSEYFTNKRAIAIGLAVCGSGIGTFLFGPLLGYLVNMYSWRGSLLIVSGILLNSCVCGALFRRLPSPAEAQIAGSSGHGPIENAITVSDSIPQHSADPTTIDNFNQSAMIESPWEYKGLFETDARSHQVNPLAMHKNCSRLPMNFASNYLNNAMSSCGSYNHDNQHNAFTPSRCSRFRDSTLDLFNPYLLKNGAFVIFAISNFLTSLGFYAPFLFAVDRAILMGVQPLDASFLIASLGVGNTLGRIAFGALATRGSFRFRLHLYNGSLVLAGFITIASSLANTYPRMIANTMSFGFCIGTYVTLTPVILVDLLGIACLGDAFGLSMFFMGIAVFVGPPMAGWIYDASGSYDLSFAVCGSVILASGAVMYPLTCGTWMKPVKPNRV